MSDIRDLVKEQFGAHAQNYVNSTDHSKSDSLDRVVELAHPQPEWRTLDIATGGGHTARAFAPRVREVVATDLTPAMLAAAEKFITGQGFTNVTFREADATALPFADGEFDLVTCRIAPHHFPDCAGFAREMARVLKPGGVAALIDNIVPGEPVAAKHINAFEKLRDPSHNWAYALGEWEAFLAAAGFEITHSEIFRKALDFDYWTGRMSVAEPTKTQLRVMLKHAPAPAREALTPEFSGDPLTGVIKFYLTEALIIATRLPKL
jgi:ubiquinone/menaquinone biosynthesis C-methylase UbiE